MYSYLLENVDLLDAIEFNLLLQDENIEESSTLSKLTLQTRIRKNNAKKGVSINSVADLIKNHSNPGLAELVNKSKDVDELRYIKKDTQTIFGTLNKIKERITLCRQQGETNKTKSYYKNIKKMYIDKGITEKDVEKTIENMKKLIEDINKRIKELEK